MSTRDAAFKFSIPASATRQRRPSELEIKFTPLDPEVAMQLMVDGEWHRPMLDPLDLRTSLGIPHETACEVSTIGKYAGRRAESYEGKLCTRGCFTAAELARASAYVAAIEKRRADALAKEAEERERWFAENLGSRKTSPGIGPVKKPNGKDEP